MIFRFNQSFVDTATREGGLGTKIVVQKLIPEKKPMLKKKKPRLKK